MWLNEFKVALLEKDADKLELLLNTMPTFDTLKEMEEALFLSNEALTLVNKLKTATSASIVQIRKSIDFIKSTQQVKNSLDIKL
ncbi:MAG: hypothetical protein GQ570_06390 [Helicobacteraceae bacterium]|nr:hypothetical protein [Helicobacteraceae bacterium]